MTSTGAERGDDVPVWHFGDSLAELAGAVARGRVLAIPTESSYGLGVDPRNRDAVETVYRIKHREPRRPLLVVVANAAQLAEVGVDVESPLFASYSGGRRSDRGAAGARAVASRR